jgi:hypothetical protein
MARPQAFARELQIATAGLTTQEIAKLLAQTARQELSDAQASGEAPASFVRYVNGREGVPEEQVNPPGPILYAFSWLSEVAEYALAYAEERSPVKSGRFKKSWFALVNGAPAIDMAEIPPDAELIITNDQPYSRKIEVGHMRMSVPPGIVQDLRQAVMRRFGNSVTAQVRFIPLAGGYTLKRASRRKDRTAGRALSYPALVVNMRFL